MVFSRPTKLSPLADRRRKEHSDDVLRRPSETQARALEVLAHALEYLQHGTAVSGSPPSAATAEAAVILAEKSRAVFASCSELPALSHRHTGYLPALVKGQRAETHLRCIKLISMR